MWHIVVITVLSVVPCNGHGQITWPPNRHGAQKKDGGACINGACSWFSQVSEIPGEPTLDQKFRTLNVNISGGLHDVTRKNPWRAPGTAPVRGSGCGVAGGGPIPYDGSGADVPPGTVLGQDGASLPRKNPTVWKAGSVQEVAWSINANHNGGYSWRLCKNDAPRIGDVQQSESSDPLPKCVADPTCEKSTCRKCSSSPSWSCDECCDGCSKASKGEVGPIAEGSLCNCAQKNGTIPPEPVSPKVNEACFQKNTLRFATSSSWIEWTNGTRLEFPLMKVTEGTYPSGSEWARNPIPACHMCDSYDECGPGVEPTTAHDDAYSTHAWCSGYCNGQGQKDATGLSKCPIGKESYPAPAGLSGFGYGGVPGVYDRPWPWSIVDKVEVPNDLPLGDYFLSWRWDCEQSGQVWQSCADVRIEANDVAV